MPVPTETFRNKTTLNFVFAASSILLVVATIWMVIADHARPWRRFHVDAQRWETAMTEDAKAAIDTIEYRQGIDALNAEIARIRSEQLPMDQIAAKEFELVEIERQIARDSLPAAVDKSNITPTSQKLERTRISEGTGSDSVKQLQKQLDQYVNVFNTQARALAEKQKRRDQLEHEVAQLRAREVEKQLEVSNLEQVKSGFEEKLALLKPTGLARLVSEVRNAPLLDWAHPSIKPRQQVVPDVLTDYNFMTVGSIDRCHTCHVNIDQPKFERTAQILFVERQVARLEGHALDPVVMIDFWRDCVAAIDQLADRRSQINQSTFERINQLHDEAGSDRHLQSVMELDLALEELTEEPGDEQVSQNRWYQLREDYRRDLQNLLAQHLPSDQYAQLLELYRRLLIRRYNDLDSSGHQLSESPVMLAHPDLDLYVEAESKHPMKTMGCTVCHEGSGQETQFEHTAHAPRAIWVDARTGAPVPEFLVGQSGSKRQIQTMLAASHHPVPGLRGGKIVMISNAENAADDDQHDHHPKSIQYDINLLHEDDPAPFGPLHDSANAAAYRLPGADEQALAVRQADYWTKQYGWHHVHYVHWEKPMHAMEYVESSCARCHREIYDIREAAPRLFEGRHLFSKLGCINCHAVQALKDDLDIKKVGPSLVHLKHKLAEPMVATWIWSPRAFRPTSRMPHYFMLENNSNPDDIRRTRVEVAAIARYLLDAQPTASYYTKSGLSLPTYQPEPPPDEEGDADRGRTIFNNVGCLACHSNLAEVGQQWITQHMVEQGQGEAEAANAYEQMSYNQRHWYVLEHLSDRLELTGPELSGVGTKLMAGRDQQQAHQWLYDWLRNPRHYNSYTIMPNFRLAPDEANDIATYLLTLQRPGAESNDTAYVPGDFGLDDADGKMLRELLAVLGSGTTTLDFARAQIEEEHADDDTLLRHLGSKMISHYGCSGCHLINGFEESVSACTNLDEWGLKDPHKLAFEFFDRPFDEHRLRPIPVTRVKHEGLAASAPEIDSDSDMIETIDVGWEHIELERRPWAYHKLHNPRIWDRGRKSLNLRMDDEGVIQSGKPYEKTKMPKFFLTDRQVRALVTYVTSNRKPLVNANLQDVVDDAGLRVIRGRQLATLYNCYGCHNIEGNAVNIQQYYQVRNEDGTYNDNALNWAPPRLIGQAAKTQPDWLYNFLQNVQLIRPWLKVRMPSFAIGSDEAGGLVDYFAGHAHVLARRLREILAPIDKYRKTRRGDGGSDADWFEAPVLRKAVEKLKAFGFQADMVFAYSLDPRENDREDLRANWTQLLADVRILTETYDTEYPYVKKYRPQLDPIAAARGEQLFVQMGCMTGECHRMGDEAMLIKEGLLAPPNPFGPAAEDEDDYYYSGDEDDDGKEEEKEDEEDDDYGDEPDGDGDSTLNLAPPEQPSGAPNLTAVAERIQPRWFGRWLRYALRIQPGTRMQQYWMEDKSFFHNYPEDTRRKWEALFGTTSPGQLDLLRDFIYSAGPKGYTYRPEGQRLDVAEQAPIKLRAMAPLEAPAADDSPAPEKDADGDPPPTASPAVPPPAPVAPQPPPKTTSDIELHDDPTAPYSGTRIVGQVKYLGKPKARKRISMAADALCAASSVKVLTEQLIVNDDTAIQNVFVHVVSGLPKKQYVADEPTVIDQRGCICRPHVAGVVVGAPVHIRSSDHTRHNVKGKSWTRGLFNLASPPGVTLEQSFTKPQLVELKCDVHSWMTAYLHVVENPFFAVSDVEGRFEIVGLPPGQYTLEAVHEHKSIASIVFEVQVQPDTSHRVEVAVRRGPPVRRYSLSDGRRPCGGAGVPGVCSDPVSAPAGPTRNLHARQPPPGGRLDDHSRADHVADRGVQPAHLVGFKGSEPHAGG